MDPSGRYELVEVGPEAYGIILHERAAETLSFDTHDKACDTFWPPEGFDGEKAATRNPNDQPILWTFIVNFDVWVGDHPVGCLWFYRRVPGAALVGEGQATATPPPDEFVPINDKGFLINTCEVSQAVADSRDGDFITMTATDSAECELNLAVWTEFLWDEEVLHEPQPAFGDFESDVQNFTPSNERHEYDLMTLAAVLGVPQPGNILEWPALCYREGAMDVTDYPPCAASLSIYFGNAQVLTLAPGCTPVRDTAGFDRNPGALHYYWQEHEYRATATPQSQAHYAIGNAYATEEAAVEYERCNYDVALDGPLEFPIGLVTLRIGGEPVSGPPEGTDFEVIIDAVIVDPTNSTPPGGGDIH